MKKGDLFTGLLFRIIYSERVEAIRMLCLLQVQQDPPNIHRASGRVLQSVWLNQGLPDQVPRD